MGRRDGPRRDDLPATAAAMLVRATAVRPDLVDAALASEAVRRLIADYPEIYTEAGIRRSPIVRAEFEHATVIGHPGEALAIGLRKNWGGFLGFRPLRDEDPVDPRFVLYVFKSGNPYNRRVLQRRTMKSRLPRAYRRWVNEAYRNPRRNFLAQLPADAAEAIRCALGLDPIRFWRAARGVIELDRPEPAVQSTLFDDPGASIVSRWRK